MLPLWAIGIILATVLGAAYLLVSKKKKSEEKNILEPIEEMVIPDPIEEIDLELSGSQVKQQIEKLVNKKPDAVAQLLKNWLNED
jgi:flagellar M-ring protein FliF